MSHHDENRHKGTEDPSTLGEIMHERGSSEKADRERADRVAGIRPGVDHLPAGTGYTAEHLPTKVNRQEAELLDAQKIPDKVREEEMDTSPEDPVPSPEDEFYDFDKDVYGDGTEYKG